MFAVAGAKIGDTVNARKPPRYIVGNGQAVTPQSMVETSVPVKLTDQLNVALDASTADFALSIDEFSTRFLGPAAKAIANQIDFLGTSRMYKQVWNWTGTPGTPPSSVSTALALVSNSKLNLDNNGTPSGPRHMVLSSSQEQSIVSNLTATVYNPQRDISEQYREGSMGRLFGFEMWMDQNIYTHTVGTLAGTPLVNGANQTGNSLITDGWTATTSVLNEGDIITIDKASGGVNDVNAVNPQSRVDVGSRANFVVTATTFADGSGNMTIPISPAIVPSGQFQNVTAVPDDNGVIKTFGAATTYSAKTTPQGLAFHPDAFTLVTADLPVYEKGVVEGYRVASPQLGISLRVIKAYNVLTDQLVTRVDVLMGWALLYGELATRIVT
jgi:hypothetical protein